MSQQSPSHDTYYDVTPEDDDIDERITIRPTADGYASTGARSLFSSELEST